MNADRNPYDYSWDTICKRCGINLGGHNYWNCPTTRGIYDGPLVPRDTPPINDLRTINEALMAALDTLLNFDGHLADCIGTLRPGLECSEECEQARAALALARGKMRS